MGSDCTHTVRNSVRDDETAFHLSEEALILSGGPKQQELAYRNIAELNLITYQADIADAVHAHGLLTIRPASGKRLKLRSHHLKGLGSYESRAETYAPFVRELCRRVAAANPEAGFTLGSNMLPAVWLTVLILTVPMAAMLAIATLSEGPRWPSVQS